MNDAGNRPGQEHTGPGNPERRGLSGAWPVLFAVVSLGLFAVLALLVVRDTSLGFDTSLLRALRGSSDPAIPVGPAWLSHAARDITALGGVTVLGLATALTVICLLLARRVSMAIMVFLAVCGGWVVSALLKIGIARPRPDIVPHLVQVYDYSFPSGHAMLSAVTWLTLGVLAGSVQPRRSIRIFLPVAAVALTLAIGMSRVFLGVHYPSDVLAGWCAGAAWATICYLVSTRLSRIGNK